MKKNQEGRIVASGVASRKNEERKLAEQKTKFGSKSEEELHAYAWMRMHMRATQRPIHAWATQATLRRGTLAPPYHA
ncbi:hypothetical protein PIB30_094609 [Stylosanthes scabra]|uniref:Uncharacterized protein n=1 Tax=Stylosanthes scabra TaxID=79078 RepID=A0ABU6ZUV6_9FABA|nr:hypothetical protein [Stylosanthes scabra]